MLFNILDTNAKRDSLVSYAATKNFAERAFVQVSEVQSHSRDWLRRGSEIWG